MLLLWILLAVSLSKGEDQPPSFPSDFKVDVLVDTWWERGLKLYTIAYTAKGNGRGNLLYVSETSDNKEYIKMIDFGKDTIILANTLDESCNYANGIQEVEKTNIFFPVDFERRGHQVQFLTPDKLFRFDGKKTPESSIAAGLSRWSSTTVLHDSPSGKDVQCNISFAWTTNGTKTPRCDRNAENVNACPPIPVVSQLLCDKETATYTFSSYTEELDYSIFQEPLGFYCGGKEKASSLPKLPSVFSLRAENIFPGSGNVVWYSYLWADLKNGAVATRHREESEDVIIISDYRAGYQYEIDVTTETCVPRAMGGEGFTPKSKEELVWGEEIADDIQHSGDHRCRLSDCRVYATTTGEKVQNLYYAYDNALDFGIGEARRPAYMETREKGVVQRQRHVVAFDEDVRYWDVFNLYRCFHQGDIRTLAITLEGNTNFDKDIESLHDLREAYREAVVEALGISQTLRFTIFWFVPNDTRTGMTATGFVFPARNDKGFEDADTDAAIEHLKSVVDQRKFLFRVNASFGNDPVTYKAVSVSNGYRKGAPSASAVQATQGYTSGNMAGLGFGMLFLGIVLTAAAVYVAVRVCPKNQISAIFLQNQG
ncbi:uncharacterized protein LOC135375705 [Ornithodoros turicata]|uniref:uncharacterized protein LOC135375705 n=1 Tax=Ornithodoros turicata TaxID=34597 RepID=UPI003138E2B9